MRLSMAIAQRDYGQDRVNAAMEARNFSST